MERRRCTVLNNLQGVMYSLESHLCNTIMQTHMEHVINIVSRSGSYHSGGNQLLSPEQQMCGRKSREKLHGS